MCHNSGARAPVYGYHRPLVGFYPGISVSRALVAQVGSSRFWIWTDLEHLRGSAETEFSVQTVTV